MASSCGSGENKSVVDSTLQHTTAYEAGEYDSTLCEKLVLIAGCDMTPEQFAQMVNQANLIADEMNKRMREIIDMDLNEISVSKFKSMYKSRKFQMGQKFASEIYIDMDAKKIPAEVQKRAEQVQHKTAEMQRTFEMMYMNMSGFDGDAGGPQFYLGNEGSVVPD